jgi:iduronate 2-sulfatase
MNQSHNTNAICTAALLAAPFTLLHAADNAKPTLKPNVLMLIIDDLRPELACYGQTQLKTPNIDKVASQGLIFNRSYCNVPVSGASRASLMTGILPTPTRFIAHNSRADEDVPGAKTLPQVFREAGYTTISNGKIFHESADCAAQSWSQKHWGAGASHDTNLDSTTTKMLSSRGRGRIYESPDVPDNAYPDGKVAEKTIKDIQQLKASGKPFFLACGFIRPHLPFYAPKKYWDMYERENIPIADNRAAIVNSPKVLKTSNEYTYYHFGDYKDKTDAFHQMMRHGYYASTTYADKLVGDVLNELEKQGLAENTIVVIFGDHGWHLGEHEFWGKHNTLYNAIRTPLIIKVPQVTKKSKTDAMVQYVDLFPTLCDLANLSVPSTVQGKSYKSVIEKPSQSFNEVVYSRYHDMNAVFDKQYTYTLFDNGEEMLYNRADDPQENVNIVANPTYTEQLKRMRSNLKAQMDKAKNLTLNN